MTNHGLRDSPFDADLIEDDDGNRLQIKGTRGDVIIFSIVVKRGMRALITRDDDCRMVEYSGVVRLRTVPSVD
jgi:hypothetical protein